MTDSNDITPPGNEKQEEKLQSLEHLHAALHTEDDSFENEAAEGLQQLPHEKIPEIISGLNKGLQQHINKKKKNKRTLPDQTAVYITIVTILLLAVVTYIIIKKLG